MKRIFTIALVLLLTVALLTGCGKKTEEAAPAAETAAPAAEEAAPAATLSADVVRLESIDLDPATNGLILSVTPGKVEGTEADYQLNFGDTEKHPLAADAMIDFPMADDLTKSVTLMPEELTSEFLAFVEEFGDKPLFTMTLEGDAIKSLQYFYLP